ncbi:MAG: ABC transporter permease [Candidatus Bathyarchaeia archaeon]
MAITNNAKGPVVMKKFIKERLKSSKGLLVVYLCIVLLLGFGAIIKPHLVSGGSLSSILRWSSILGMVAIGQTIVMVSGGIDVSVGAVVFLSSILGATLMQGENNAVLPTLIICLGIGLMCGLFNGLVINFLRLPSIIVTLSLSIIINGVVWLYTGGVTRGGPAPALVRFAQSTLAGYIPLSFIFWLCMAFVFTFLMRATVFGRLFHAVGSNPTAAYLSGINVSVVSIASYIISGVCASVAGVLLLGYLAMATLRFSDIYTLGSIAAAAIGGTPFFTGLGTIMGTVGGTLIIRILFNLLLMFQIPEAGRIIANGLLLLVVASVYGLQQRR